MTWWKRRGERLKDEIQAHIHFEVQENIDAGMSPGEAHHAAMRKFGNVLLARERSREIWGWLWAERLWQDIRYALRGLGRNPGFSAVAILSLALGIGATTSMFSLMYAVLLHPVPYADWQRLTYPIYLNDDQPTSPERWFTVTWPQYQQLLKTKSVEDALGDYDATSEITGQDIPEEVTLTYITENAGSFLRVPALLGRNIQPSDAEAVRQQAMVVLSYDFWMRHYNGDRNVLGRTLELDRKPYSIVGVMPKEYAWERDLYTPMSLAPTSDRNVLPIMKLKPGVSLASANAEIDALVHQFAKETPQYFPSHFRMHLEHIIDRILIAVGHTLILLFAAVLMLLIIGCSNCSILLLARGMSRQSELAVRAALGASRYRIVRQLVVEALVLAITGSLLGILLAYWMARLIFSLFPDVFMHESVVRINLPVLAFSIALALVSGLLFGLLPSLRMSRPDVSKVMQATGRRIAIGQARPLSALIAAQIALTTIIMGAAGAAIGGFMQMTHRNFGYDPAHVMSVPIPLHQHSYPSREGRAAYFKELQEKIAAVPGITGVALSAAAIPPHSGSNRLFEILGVASSTQRQYLRVSFISPEYFSTLHIPLLEGRLWDETENARGGAVAVINQTLARRYFPKGDAIGQQIRTPTLTLQIGDPGQLVGVPDINGWLQVIGVVADSLNDGLDKPVEPALYMPYARFMWMNTAFLVRTQGSPLASLHDVQRAILSVNPDQQTDLNVLDLSQWIEQQPEFKQQRLFSILFGLFSGLALTLALVGLYSVVSYSVAQRTNEFGIRMALGAQRANVLSIVCRSIGITVSSGLLAGLLIFLTLHKLLAHWTQNGYSSPLILAAVVALFIICAALACTIPALRATSIDPMQALRYE
jgi:predicted permease